MNSLGPRINIRRLSIKLMLETTKYENVSENIEYKHILDILKSNTWYWPHTC